MYGSSYLYILARISLFSILHCNLIYQLSIIQDICKNYIKLCPQLPKPCQFIEFSFCVNVFCKGLIFKRKVQLINII